MTTPVYYPEFLAQYNDYIRDLDVLVFHDPITAYNLRDIDKPKLVYNHHCMRTWTFAWKYDIKYDEPLLRRHREKVRQEKIELARKGYEIADVVLTNSKFTQSMLRKYFGVNSQVVYPPIDRDKFFPDNSEQGDFFLSVQRITNYAKRVEMQVDIFKDIDENLIIVGNGGYAHNLDAIIEDYPNIIHLSNVNDDALVYFYRQAKATIQTSLMEDFGLVPLESMACGTPAIVVDEGGFKETVNDKVGIRVRKPYIKNFQKILASFDKSKYNKQELYDYTAKFSKERYIKEMEFWIHEAYKRHYNSKSKR